MKSEQTMKSRKVIPNSLICIVIAIMIVGLSACGSNKGTDSSIEPGLAGDHGVGHTPTSGQATIEAYLDNQPSADGGLEATGDRCGFNLSAGEVISFAGLNDLVKELTEAEQLDVLNAQLIASYDLFLDATHGLVANATFAGWELGVGQGGIISMGVIGIGEVSEAPKDGYQPMVEPSLLVKGHTFCVRTADGEHYGKFEITEYAENPPALSIRWHYQPNGSRTFD